MWAKLAISQHFQNTITLSEIQSSLNIVGQEFFVLQVIAF